MPIPSSPSHPPLRPRLPLAPRLRQALAAPLLALAVAAGLPGHAQGAVQAFQGSFQVDDDLALFAFDLPAGGQLAALTRSHGSGGFAPVLSLFGADGYFVAGNVGSSNVCTGGGSFCWDAQLSIGLVAGAYLLVLSQDGNEADPAVAISASSAAAAFSQTGQHAYTSPFLLGTVDPSVHFVRVDGSQRSGQWALDIDVAAAVNQVPEPGSGLLVAGGLALLARRVHARRPQGRAVRA